MHGKGMCPRPTSRVHVHHQNDQDPGKFHIARLHCILFPRTVGVVSVFGAPRKNRDFSPVSVALDSSFPVFSFSQRLPPSTFGGSTQDDGKGRSPASA